MRKSLVFLSLASIFGVASAQSSLLLYGVIDAGVSGYSNSSADHRGATLLDPGYINQGRVKLSQQVLSNSAMNSSRIGFRGTEDLGGGLAASFWLESGITNDDGQTGISAFGRRSTVSLSGGLGEIRMGRDYTPTFWNDTIFDPFGANGVATSLVLTALGRNLDRGGSGGFGGNPNLARASNSIGYILPKELGGFYGQVMYVFNEKTKYKPGAATPAAADAARAGRYVGGRLGYASGPIDIALAYGDQTTGDQFFEGTTDRMKLVNLGASYDLDVVKLMGEVSRAKSQRDYAVEPAVRKSDSSVTTYLVGGTMPVGPGLIRVSYARTKYDLGPSAAAVSGKPSASKWAIGYVHNLSKRTALYATLTRINNENGAGLSVGGPSFIANAVFTPRSSVGYDLGIRHAF